MLLRMTCGMDTVPTGPPSTVLTFILVICSNEQPGYRATTPGVRVSAGLALRLGYQVSKLRGRTW